MPAKKLTVAIALHTYRGADGEYRTALRGEQIELDDAELERALELGAAVEGDVDPLPGPVLEPNPPVAPEDAGVLNDDEDDKASRPARSNTRK